MTLTYCAGAGCSCEVELVLIPLMDSAVRSVDSLLDTSALGTTGRVIRLLSLLAEAEKDLTRAEIAERLGLPRATAHRTLRLLAEYDFVAFAPATKTYAPGRELYRVAALLTATDRLPRHARSVMKELVGETGETSLLALYRSNDHRLVWSLLEQGHQVLGYTIDFGTRATLLWGASGRSILAFLPADTIDFVVARDAGQRSLTLGMLPPPIEEMKKELELIRGRGYATSLSHVVPHAFSISAPVFDSTASVCAALSLSIPEMRVESRTVANFAPLVVEAAARVSALLGNPTDAGG